MVLATYNICCNYRTLCMGEKFFRLFSSQGLQGKGKGKGKHIKNEFYMT